MQRDLKFIGMVQSNSNKVIECKVYMKQLSDSREMVRRHNKELVTVVETRKASKDLSAK